MRTLLQYVCRLNRLGRKGGRADFGVVRSEIKAIFTEMRAKADATPGMVGPYNEIELVLMFFVDSMILNTKIGSCALTILDKPSGQRDVLKTQHRALFEILTDDRGHGVTIRA